MIANTFFYIVSLPKFKISSELGQVTGPHKAMWIAMLAMRGVQIYIKSIDKLYIRQENI